MRKLLEKLAGKRVQDGDRKDERGHDLNRGGIQGGLR
jgi:hypothetical protein